MHKDLNGYVIKITKITNGEESTAIPLFVENKDIEEIILKNPIINFGIDHLKQKINQ